jgi:hypothetical protein
VFTDEGVDAVEDGRVIASAQSLEEIRITASDDKDEAWPKGQDEDLGECPICHDDYNAQGEPSCDCKAEKDEDDKKTSATHIITPNGLKGKIMSRTPGMWGEQVTVKFENGHIAHLDTASIGEFISEKTSAIESVEGELRQALAASVDGTELGLKTREADLKDIKDKIEALARSGKTDDELVELDTLRAQASYELSEVREAIDHLAASEPYEPFAPYAIHVVEQETMGGHQSSWLSRVAQDMVDEANATDFDKLLNEGPEVFIASLETAPLADQSVTRTLAANYIRTKTAAARPEIREKYEELWLERIEACRKEESSARKQSMAKAASVKEAEIANLPDEALFG